jgi:predicted permease
VRSRLPFLDGGIREIGYALRAIFRTPIVSAVVVLSLAAGIGINTVVFSWIQARVLSPLPGVARSGRFLLVEPRNDAGNYTGASWAEYRDLRERVGSFDSLLAFRMMPLYVGEPGRVERVYGMLVSDNYFEALGLRPAVGRFPSPAEHRLGGGPPTAVISHGLWQSRFAGSPAAVARTVRVNGVDVPIVGVTPRAFQGTVSGLDFDVWLPASLAPVVFSGSRELEDRGVRGLSLLAALKPPATRDQAQRELDSALRELARIHPQTNASVRGEVLAFWQSPRGPQRMLTTAIAVLQAIMLVLLLAICGNTANLVLARASTRDLEMGVRLTLGAGPWRIARLILLENLLLAMAGAALGAAVAVWGTQALQILPMTGVPVRFQTRVDALGLACAMGLGLVSGLLVGAAPAAQLSRLDPLAALRAAVRTRSRSVMRQALMAAQAALAVAVLIAAGLFFLGLLETRSIDPGFRRDGVLLAAYDFTGRSAGATVTRTFAARVLERVRALPGVEAAAVASSVPLDIHGLPSRVFLVEGRTRPDGQFDQANANTVTPGYFALLGIGFLAGTDFTALDDPSSAPQVIVNEAFATRYAGAGAGAAVSSAIGQRILARGRTFQIVGVVRTTVSNAFGEPPTPCLYFSYRDTPSTLGEIHVRTRAGGERALGAEVRRVVRELDPELPVFNVRTLTTHIETNLVFRRVPARMFAVLGPLLLLLAAVGVYAVVAYTVSLRTIEIGVRMALGASARRVVGEIVGESLLVVTIGALLGWLAAFVFAVDLVPRLVGPAVFGGVPAILLAVAALASWLPARHAAHLDPMAALRKE